MTLSGVDVSASRATRVVTVRGALDANAHDDVRAAVRSLAQTTDRIALDLAGVDFVDSIGLGMLVRCRDELRNNLESGLSLHNPSPQVQRLLELTALRAQFDVDTTNEG